MKARLFLLLFLLLPLVVHADPVAIDGQSTIAYGIVATWALIMESGLVTAILYSSEILVMPAFFTLLLANVAVFLFAFLPLSTHVSLWILEPGVVLADAVAIKLIADAPFLHGTGVTWRRAFVASLIGNAASFFVGVLGSHEPWLDRSF